MDIHHIHNCGLILKSQILTYKTMESITKEQISIKLKQHELELFTNETGTSEVWKQFRLIRDTITKKTIKSFTACGNCYRIFQFQKTDGTTAKGGFGTKNLSDHIKTCSLSKNKNMGDFLENKNFKLSPANKESLIYETMFF